MSMNQQLYQLLSLLAYTYLEHGKAAKAITRPAADGRGPVDFRTNLTGIMVRNAIKRAAERAS